jgi:hypothetical protein
LLDNGLKLRQAADFLISARALKPEHRKSFTNAMKNRMSRFRKRAAQKETVYYWRIALGYERSHAVSSGSVALCGARAARWFPSNDNTHQCKLCRCIVTEQKVSMEEGRAGRG